MRITQPLGPLTEAHFETATGEVTLQRFFEGKQASFCTTLDREEAVRLRMAIEHEERVGGALGSGRRR